MAAFCYGIMSLLTQTGQNACPRWQDRLGLKLGGMLSHEYVASTFDTYYDLQQL